MSETNSSWDELARGVDRAANERHKFVVPRTTAHVLTLDDLAFNTASPVLLPAPAKPKRVEGGVVTGLSVIAQALKYAAAHSDQKLTLFAHCAPLGSAVSEVGLSELRAQNVLAYLQGNRDAWAASCAAHVFDDVRRVQEWAQHRGLTWPAHGGDEDDWKVAYDLYDQQLALLLGVDDLDAARGKLSFGDPAELGCGAFWPRGGGSRAASKDEASVVTLGGSRARSADTRVDLLFAEPDVRLPEQPSDQAPGVRVFSDERFVFRDRIEPEPEPAAVVVRMTGMHFDTSKCFLLPSAMPGIRTIKDTYDKHSDSHLLVVGHTDTAGDVDSNLTLSLERADAIAAFLTDQTPPWEAFFGAGKPDEKRWGTREIQSMLSVIPEPGGEFYAGPIDGIDGAQTQEAVRDFQAAEGLKVDGIAGPLTRKALIAKYMAQDGTSLPAGMTLTAQGAGESFPAEATADGVHNAHNRRAELFFFDRPIEPAAPADRKSRKGSPEYPAWLAQVIETIHVSVEDDVSEAAIIGLHPPLFDTIPDAATLTVTPAQGPAEVFPLRSGIDLGDGLLHFVVESPKPGMLYTAEVRLSADEDPTVLFAGFELHQLVAERQGATDASVPALGGDALVFESEADQPPPDDGEAVEGGPLETSDEQLAQFNARAGSVAVA